MRTGTISPRLSAVLALKSVVNFAMFGKPAEANFGPGLASPPGSSNFTAFAIFLLT